MENIFSTLISINAVVALLFTATYFFLFDKRNRPNRMLPVMTFGSALWSLANSGLILSFSNLSFAKNCYFLEILGIFLYIVAAEFLLLRYSNVSGIKKLVFTIAAWGGVLVAALAVNPAWLESAFLNRFERFTSLFKTMDISEIFLLYILIACVCMFLEAIGMMNSSQPQKVRAFGRKFFWAIILNVVGTFFDQIFPKYSYLGFPGSVLTQFFGLMVMWQAVKKLENVRINAKNLADSLGKLEGLPVLVYGGGGGLNPKDPEEERRKLQYANEAAANYFNLDPQKPLDSYSMDQLFANGKDIDLYSGGAYGGGGSYDAMSREGDRACKLQYNTLYDDYNTPVGSMVKVYDAATQAAYNGEMAKNLSKEAVQSMERSNFLVNEAVHSMNRSDSLANEAVRTMDRANLMVDEANQSMRRAEALSEDARQTKNYYNAKLNHEFNSNTMNPGSFFDRGNSSGHGGVFEHSAPNGQAAPNMPVAPNGQAAPNMPAAPATSAQGPAFVPNASAAPAMAAPGQVVPNASAAPVMHGEPVAQNIPGAPTIPAGHIAPNGQVVSPEPAHFAPNGQVVSPEPAHFAPNGQVASPEPAHFAPNGQVVSPGPAHFAPNGQVVSPGPAHFAPNGQVVSPEPAHFAPDGSTIIPEQRQTAPTHGSFNMEAGPVMQENAPGEGIMIRGAKALIVCPNEPKQKELASKLAECGVKVDVAENPKEALKLGKTNNYSLLFVDENIPYKNSTKLLNKIRNYNDFYKENCKIVALSTDTPEKTRDRQSAAGFDGFIGGKINKATVEDMLRTFIPKEKFCEGTTFDDLKAPDVVKEKNIDDLRASFQANKTKKSKVNAPTANVSPESKKAKPENEKQNDVLLEEDNILDSQKAQKETSKKAKDKIKSEEKDFDVEITDDIEFDEDYFKDGDNVPKKNPSRKFEELLDKEREFMVTKEHPSINDSFDDEEIFEKEGEKVDYDGLRESKPVREVKREPAKEKCKNDSLTKNNKPT